jgi:hypothetical protein
MSVKLSNNYIEFTKSLLYEYQGALPAFLRKDDLSIYLETLSNGQRAAYIRYGLNSFFMILGESFDSSGRVCSSVYIVDVQAATRNHPIHVSRFIYRMIELASKMVQSDLKLTFISEIEIIVDQAPLTIKYVMPSFIDNSSIDLEGLNNRFASRRLRNRKLYNLATQTSDEVELSSMFLEESFLLPKIHSCVGSVYGIGSCFAQNMVRAIQLHSSPNVSADAFPIADDMNTPLANLRALSLALGDENSLDQYFESISYTFNRHRIDFEGVRALLTKLSSGLKQADLILFTLGGIVDFWRDGESFDRLLTNFGVPAHTVTSYGFKPKLAKMQAVRSQILSIIDLILNNTSASLMLTVSPVPMVNALGVSSQLGGIFSLDTVAKSSLRSSLHEILEDHPSSGGRVVYFPSYEFVRTLSLYRRCQTFGVHDYHLDHIDPKIIIAIAEVFLKCVNLRTT